MNAVRASCKAKQALNIFVNGVFIQVHKYVVADFEPDLNDGIRKFCGSCSTQDLIPCRTKFTCSRFGKCTFHGSQKRKAAYKCRKGICCKIMSKIVEVCVSNWTPSWKHSNAKLWQVNHWEIVKCFLPSGVSDNSDDISLHGWLGIAIKCKFFHDELGEEDFKFLQEVQVTKIFHLSFFNF